jgi:predicted secreted protein
VGALIIREARECLGTTVSHVDGEVRIKLPKGATAYAYDRAFWVAHKAEILAALAAESEGE